MEALPPAMEAAASTEATVAMEAAASTEAAMEAATARWVGFDALTFYRKGTAWVTECVVIVVCLLVAKDVPISSCG